MWPLPELQGRIADAISTGRLEQALAAVAGDGLAPASRLQIYRNHFRITLASALGNEGAAADSAGAVEELLRRKPDYTGETARQELFFCKDETVLDRYVAGLHAAGVPLR